MSRPYHLTQREAYVLARAPVWSIAGRWQIEGEIVSDIVARLLTRGLLYLPQGCAGQMADLTPEGWSAKSQRFAGVQRWAARR